MKVPFIITDGLFDTYSYAFNSSNEWMNEWKLCTSLVIGIVENTNNFVCIVFW